MRWHYISGVFFGIFALTWVFSGLLSMEPFDWANADEGLDIRGDALTGGPVELERFPPFAAEPWNALLAGRTLKEIEFRRIDDAPYYLARYTATSAEPDPRRERLHQPYPITGRAEPQHMLVDARTLTARTEPFRDGDSARAPARGRARRVDRDARAARGLRRLLLLAQPPGGAARAAREVRRPARDVGLRRSRARPARRVDPSPAPRRALALQRPAQPRLRLLVRPPAAVGHRHDPACAWARSRRARSAFGSVSKRLRRGLA